MLSWSSLRRALFPDTKRFKKRAMLVITSASSFFGCSKPKSLTMSTIMSPKRPASPPPDQRPAKRPSTSSPEEGELDDADPSAPPPPSDIQRPSSPSGGRFEPKIKFPFKPKPPPTVSESRASSRFTYDDRKSTQHHDRAPDDDHRRRFRDHRPQDGPPLRRRMGDRWVPDERGWERDRDRDRDRRPPWDSSWDRHSYDSRSYRPLPPPPSMQPYPPRGVRDRHSDRNFDRDIPRDLARTPPHRPHPPLSPRQSQSRSPSPSPNHHRKHRLPTRRSPAPAFSPLSNVRSDKIRYESCDNDQRPRNKDTYWRTDAPPPGVNRPGHRDGTTHDGGFP